jgi:hypothetical protein
MEEVDLDVVIIIIIIIIIIMTVTFKEEKLYISTILKATFMP